jgi:hypothetical protein
LLPSCQREHLRHTVAKRLTLQALFICGGNIFGQLRYRWP